ncbi:MAG: D-aminoacyl-tRNA deacylase, partial [Micrococcaceae bacterium]|nr:D-aminoacyl-tRNA deacylase [Micrococcaceae bacterium]
APLLVISQFTLYGDVRKGRRPGWTKAAPGTESEPLYEEFMARLRSLGAQVEAGVFGAMMEVSLVNTGPYTLIVDTDDLPG